MSDTNTNDTNVNDGQTNDTEPKTPDLNTETGRAEHSVRFALTNPDSIPAKFKREDGTVDVDGLTKSYLELERQRSGKTSDDTTPTGANEPSDPVDDSTPANSDDRSLADDLTDPPAPEGSDLWKSVTDELNEKGSLSEATVAGLKKAGVPQELINAAIEGRAARIKSDRQAAYEVVGGEDQYNDTMKWAKDNLSAEDRAEIVQGLKGPRNTALLVLQGLHARAVASGMKSGNSGQVNTATTGSPSIPSNNNQLKPFGSVKEQMEAMRDPRYMSDTVYRTQVMQRVALGAGHSNDLTQQMSGV